MSSDICLSPYDFQNDLEKLSSLLIENYNKNNAIVLNLNDENILNTVANQLEEISHPQNIHFNKEGFKNFVKKIFISDIAQTGGHGEIIPNNPQTNRYDFFAVLMFATSIILLYISFVKFNDLTKSVTGMNIKEVSQDIQDQINEAVNTIKDLHLEQVTFIQYIWSIIITFSCSIINKQTSRIQDIVAATLINSITDFSDIATNNCLPRTEVVTEGLYVLSSIGSFDMGNVDIGRMINTIIQSASVATAPQATSSCLTNTVLSLQRTALATLFNQQSLIINRINAQSSQAINFLYYGVYCGVPSAVYLIYRTKDIPKVAYKLFTSLKKKNNSIEYPENESVTIFSRKNKFGGKKYKTRKYKKNKKHKKNNKSKRYKKYTRKYR